MFRLCRKYNNNNSKDRFSTFASLATSVIGTRIPLILTHIRYSHSHPRGTQSQLYAHAHAHTLAHSGKYIHTTVKMSEPIAVAMDAESSTTATTTTTTTASELKTQELVEGKARIPYSIDEGVFYNKVQVFNRDLSVVVLSNFSALRKQEREEKAEKRAKRRADQSSKLGDKDGAPIPKSTTSQYVSPPGIRILEALSATGLRSIRYYLEVPGVHQIVANDFDKNAVEAIRQNIEYNQLSPTTQIIPSHADARLLLYSTTATSSPATVPSTSNDSESESAANSSEHDQFHDKRFDVIDLDPYGSAAEFLDGAIQSVGEGGLLAVTCTDKAILCGNYPETCYARYGGVGLRGRASSEMAVRLLLGCMQSIATRYRRYIVPMISLSIDFYVRVFVRVYTSPLQVKQSASQMAVVYQCCGCETTHFQPMGRVTAKDQKTKYPNSMGPPCSGKCDECGQPFRFGGPIWSNELHSVPFLEKCLEYVKVNIEKFATTPRIIGMLTTARDELPTPLFYTLSGLCYSVHTKSPKISVLRAALIHAGYKVSQSHVCPDAIKTNAPSNVMWDIIRCYVKSLEDSESTIKKLPENSVAANILAKEPKLQADFSFIEGCDLSSQATGVAKFLPNPEENWGPKARAKKRVAGEEIDDQMTKARKNQGKNAHKKQKICGQFSKTGACRFGDRCKFLHPSPESMSTNDGTANGESDMNNAMEDVPMKSSTTADKS